METDAHTEQRGPYGAWKDETEGATMNLGEFDLVFNPFDGYWFRCGRCETEGPVRRSQRLAMRDLVGHGHWVGPKTDSAEG